MTCNNDLCNDLSFSFRLDCDTRTVAGVKCLPPKWVNQCVEFVVRAKYTCMDGLYVSIYNSKLTACKVTLGNT